MNADEKIKENINKIIDYLEINYKATRYKRDDGNYSYLFKVPMGNFWFKDHVRLYRGGGMQINGHYWTPDDEARNRISDLYYTISCEDLDSSYEDKTNKTLQITNKIIKRL